MLLICVCVGGVGNEGGDAFGVAGRGVVGIGDLLQPLFEVNLYLIEENLRLRLT